MLRSRLSRGTLIGAVVLALVTGFVVSVRHHDAASRVFDAEAWRNAAPATSIRLKMTDDLLASNRLRGMRQRDVIALLGPPDNADYARRHDFDLGYNLGPSGLGIDDEFLLIDFDENGVVARWQRSVS